MFGFNIWLLGAYTWYMKALKQFTGCLKITKAYLREESVQILRKKKPSLKTTLESLIIPYLNINKVKAHCEILIIVFSRVHDCGTCTRMKKSIVSKFSQQKQMMYPNNRVTYESLFQWQCWDNIKCLSRNQHLRRGTPFFRRIVKKWSKVKTPTKSVFKNHGLLWVPPRTLY